MKRKILLLTTLVLVINAGAQVFIENFEGATVNGNVEGYNDWYVCPKASDAYGVSPKIDEYPLFYNDYPSSNVGKVALLDSVVGATSATQRISTKRIVYATGDTLKTGTSGAMYASFLVNISAQSYRSFRDFFTWEGSETSSFTRGRVFAKNNEDGSEVTFALTKNSSSATDFDAANTGLLGLALTTGVNHLLVLKYEIVEGSSNDILSLYVNPDPTKTESVQTNKLTANDTQTDYSANTAMKINLRQRGIGAQIGGIRVGRSWDAVVMGAGTGLSTTNDNPHRIFAAGKDVVTNASGFLSIYSLSGSEVAKAEVEDKFMTDLNTGLYLVRFTDKNGVVSSAKLQIK